MPKIIDLTGKQFGFLTVVSFHSIGGGKSLSRSAYWNCRCWCGAAALVSRGNLKSGAVRSCGCNGGQKKLWKNKPSQMLVCIGCDEEKHRSQFGYSRTERKPLDHCKSCQEPAADRRRASKEKYNTRIKLENIEIRAEVLRHYGNMCQCCGESEAVFLAFDHLNGGGARHRREIVAMGFMTIARWLKANGYPEEFRILCHNCNWAEHAKAACPHRINSMVSALSFGS